MAADKKDAPAAPSAESDPQAELDAMKSVHKILKALPGDAQARVNAWVAGKLGIAAVPAAPAAARVVQVPPGAVAAAAPPPGNFEDIGALIDAADPQHEWQRALLSAYWLTEHENVSEITGQQINGALKPLGLDVGHITSCCNRLVEKTKEKPKYLYQHSKSSGKTKPRRVYKITSAGKKFVQGMLSGEHLS